jgi:hypothetical protein
MILKIDEIEKPDTLGFRLTGEVTGQNYQATVIPAVEEALAQNEKVNLLVVLDELEGFDAEAAWSDVTLWARHAGDFRRIGVVGSKDWEETMTKLAEPFTSAETRFFEKSEYKQAQEWVETGSEVKAGRPA